MSTDVLYHPRESVGWWPYEGTSWEVSSDSVQTVGNFVADIGANPITFIVWIVLLVGLIVVLALWFVGRRHARHVREVEHGVVDEDSSS